MKKLIENGSAVTLSIIIGCMLWIIATDLLYAGIRPVAHCSIEDNRRIHLSVFQGEAVLKVCVDILKWEYHALPFPTHEYKIVGRFLVDVDEKVLTSRWAILYLNNQIHYEKGGE